MSDRIKYPLYWQRNLLAYILWIIGAFLVWLVVFGSTSYLPYVPFSIDNLMRGIPTWFSNLLLPAVIGWLVLRTVISDRYLVLIVPVTLLGYLAGGLLERYIYIFVYHFLQLIPGNTVREMYLQSAILLLIPSVIVAIFQVVFMGLILKRIGWSFALAWIVAALIAGVIAPACSVAFQLRFYSPSALYPSLIQSVIFGVIAGLPLIWLRVKVRENVKTL